MLASTPSGVQIPLSPVAKLASRTVPQCSANEVDSSRTIIFIDLKTEDYGSLINEANRLFARELKIPVSSSYRWSGEYEF
ncbi:MAG TPA: hypothetical protein VJS37_12575 [Terriglobales bacterium]|nr:hypothetical protein [Terriglobales bacterium]